MDKSSQLKNKIIRKSNIFFLLVLFACAILLFWKARYGIVPNDEPFMISLGHRFLKGDIPITHDWYRAQFIGLIYLPFVWFYTSVFRSTEGLVLFCRFAFVIWWLITGAVLYYRLRQYGKKISLIALTTFYLYAPFDIMNLTYNAVSLSCLLLFFSYFLVKGNIVFDYINGIILSIAVISYPLLIIVAILYGLAVIVANISGKGKKYYIFSAKKLIRVIIPCVMSAAILFAYILINSNINSFFIGLFEVVKSNSAAERSIVLLAKNLLSTFPFDFTVGLVVLVVSVIDKRRYQRRTIYFTIQSIAFFLSIVYLLLNFHYLNVIMFPLSVLGLQAFILNIKKRWPLFICLWITGVLFAIVCYLSSDTGCMAIANGMVMSTISSFFFIFDLYDETRIVSNNNKQRVACILFSLILALQIGSELSIKIFRVYRGNLLPQMNYRVSSGVEKGIITSEDIGVGYEEIHNDVLQIKKMTNNCKSFLSVGLCPVSYLEMNDYDYSSYSVWVYVNNKIDYETENKQLTKYYGLYPDKKPDIIYSNLALSELKNKITCIDYSMYQKYELSSGLWLVRN